MEIEIKSVKVSVNGNPAEDSLFCRKNFETPISPIYNMEEPESPFVVVVVPKVLAKNIPIEITVVSTETPSVQAKIIMKETCYPVIFEDIVLTGVLYPGINKVNALLPLDKFITPDELTEMRKQVITWDWYYETATKTGPTLVGTSSLTLYLLPEIPVYKYSGKGEIIWDISPGCYNEQNTSYIWTDLLDICAEACEQWKISNGQRPRKQEDYFKAFVSHLNTSGTFLYDKITGSSQYVIKSPSDMYYVKLSKFIRDYSQPYKSILNCTDCACLVAIQSLACGLELGTSVMSNPNGGIFNCNPVISIGFFNWEIPFGRGFGYHEVNVTTPNCDITTPIYDACLKLNLSGNPADPNTSTDHALLSDGLHFAETNTPVNITIPYAGTTYRERLVENGASCNILATSNTLAGFIPDLKLDTNWGKGTINAPWLTALCGAHKNSLSASGLFSSWDKVPNFPEFKGIWTLLEDYSRYRVYSLEYHSHQAEISFWFSLDEQEAWVLLCSRLSVITNPDIVPVNLGEVGFCIGDVWKIFVLHGILVEIRDDSGHTADFEPMLIEAIESLCGN